MFYIFIIKEDQKSKINAIKNKSDIFHIMADASLHM